MGSSHASNIIDNSISAMVDLSNTTSQKCAPVATSIQQIIADAGKNCPNSTIYIHDIKMGSVARLEVKCAQEASQSAAADVQIQQAAKQMAESVTQALSLNPGSSDAQNIMRMSMNIGIAVKNNISQIIASAAASSQSIITHDYCNAEIAMIDMSTFSTSLADAAQKTSQVATAVAALKQEAEQIAKAKQESLLGPLIILLIIVAIMFFGPGKALLKYASPALYVAVPGGVTYLGYKVYRHYRPADKPKPEGFCGACIAV